MIFVSVVWLPLFYLFWRTLSGGADGRRAALAAFCAGLFLAVAYFFTANSVAATGLGFSRWLFAFVEIAGVPLIAALFFFCLCRRVSFFHINDDWTGFALLFLTPLAAVRSLVLNVGEGGGGALLHLVLPPLLWTFFAVLTGGAVKRLLRPSNGRTPLRKISFFAILSLVFIIIILALLPTVWWAFFAQRNLIAWALFGVTALGSVLVLAASSRQRGAHA